MRKFILALFAWLALASLAQADFTGKDASLATITFKNATGACTAVVCVPQAAITDSTGAVFATITTAGGDAQANTLNGLQVYTRPSIWNGTTWDRWSGAVTNAGVFPVQLSGAANNINNIAGTVSLPTGAATSTNQTTEIASLATIATNTGAAIPAGVNLIGNVGTGVYPAGSTAITASTTGTTAATTATLAANVTLHTYICGFSIRANATAAATNNATVTGTVTGTLNYTQWTAPLASGLGITEQIFSPCIISSAINTGIAVISGAPGAGGVVSVTAWGFQL